MDAGGGSKPPQGPTSRTHVGLAVALLKDPTSKRVEEFHVSRHGPGLAERPGGSGKEFQQSFSELENPRPVEAALNSGTHFSEGKQAVGVEMESRAKEKCPLSEQRHAACGSDVAEAGHAAACDSRAASHKFESFHDEPGSGSANNESDSQSYHSAEEALLANEPEQSTGTNAPMALENAVTASVEQSDRPGSVLETSMGIDSRLQSADSSEDDDLPALLGPEAFSESEDEDDEPPGLVGESDSDMDSDVDSEMESLPALGSDMSDSDSFADGSPSAEAGQSGERQGGRATAASVRASADDLSPSMRPAADDQDWDELPDLIEAGGSYWSVHAVQCECWGLLYGAQNAETDLPLIRHLVGTKNRLEILLE